MATGILSKAKHEGAVTIPPRAVPLPPDGKTTTPPGTSRLPRRIQSHKSLPGSAPVQTVNPDNPPHANRTPEDACPISVEGKDWPLVAPENASEHETEPISLPGLSNIDSVPVSSSDGSVDDNNVHVRRLCHSSSSTASTVAGPVLRIAADADAVIFGTAGDIPPVPTLPSKIPKGPNMSSRIPKGPTRQSSLATFRDCVLKAVESSTSPSVTPPAQKIGPAGIMEEMGSGPKINPIRSMKPARKLGPDGSSPKSPLSVGKPSFSTSTTKQASPAFSDTKIAVKDSDEPTQPAASTSQFKRSVDQCASAWSSSSPSSHTTQSHHTVRNQDFNKEKATETATFNAIDSCSGRQPPQQRQSDDLDEHSDNRSDDQLGKQSHEQPDEQSDDSDEQLDEYSDGQSDEESDEDSDEQLAASPTAPSPPKGMPSDKSKSTFQSLKAQRSIRDIFSRNKSRANLVGEAPLPLPNKPGFLRVFRSKSRVNLAEETRPTKQGFFGVIRSKSRFNLGETAPTAEQGFLNATSGSLAEAMPNPKDPSMPFTTPNLAVYNTSPVRKPVPIDRETRRSQLLEAIDRLVEKPDNPARRQLHLRIAKVSRASHTLLPTESPLTTLTKQAVKEVVKLTNNAEIAEATATQKSVNAAGDARQAEDWARLADERYKKIKRVAEEAEHCAQRAQTWAKNAALMAREAEISRARAEMDADHAYDQVKELWEVLEATGLEADSVVTIEELARELVHYRNPWTD